MPKVISRSLTCTQMCYRTTDSSCFINYASKTRGLIKSTKKEVRGHEEFNYLPYLTHNTARVVQRSPNYFDHKYLY